MTAEPVTDNAGLERSPRSNQPAAVKVLHVLSVSVPHLNGYTMRSRYIVNTLKAEGRYAPVVITSPFYPGNPASLVDETIDGIEYHRVPHPADLRRPKGMVQILCSAAYRIRRRGRARLARRTMGLREWLTRALLAMRARLEPYLPDRATKAGKLRLLPGMLFALCWKGGGAALRLLSRLSNAAQRARARLVRRTANLLQWGEERLLLRLMRGRVEELCRRVKPEIVHAHSPYRSALPAMQVARTLGIPFVYEVRGLWEESSVADGRWTPSDPRFLFWREMDTRVMLGADAVICICWQLREEVIRRGVAPDRVFVVPNAVCPEAFAQSEPADEPLPEPVEQVRRKLRRYTMGYVGSIRKLEGVEELLHGAAEVVRRGVDVSVLVVGDGDTLNGLKQLAAELGLGDRAVFPGRVPHDQVRHYYDLIDVFAITRPATRVARMVTPLKPLEAMALGRALVLADLPALRELVDDGVTGLLYRPGDIGDLADQCIRLMEDPLLRRRLAEQARRWVLAERTWSASLANIGEVYRTAARNAEGKYSALGEAASR